MGRALLLLAGLAASVLTSAEAEEDLKVRRAELDAVKSRIETLRQELSAAETEKNSAARALRDLEERIGAISRRIHDLDRERGIRDRHLQRLEGERAQHRAEVDQHAHLLASQVRASFVLGRQERLKLLLNQQDPVRIGRMLAYHEYLQRQRVARIEGVREALARLEETEREIAAERSRLDQLLMDERAARANLERAQTERQQVVAGLDADIRQRGAEVSRLQEDEVRLKELVGRLKQVQERLAALRDIEAEAEAEAQAGPITSRRGKLEWPSPGRIRATFGSAKGGGLSWDGVIISAPAGHEVMAIHGGRVVFADWLRGYGLLLIVDHGDGYMTLYGYNQSLFKTVGEWVKAGEVIAIVGNSGGRADPALYFGIRHNGKPVDPARWCRRISGNRIGAHAGAEWRFRNLA